MLVAFNLFEKQMGKLPESPGLSLSSQLFRERLPDSRRNLGDAMLLSTAYICAKTSNGYIRAPAALLMQKKCNNN